MDSLGGGGVFYGEDVGGGADMVMGECLECGTTFLEQWRFWLHSNLVVLMVFRVDSHIIGE